MNCFGDKYATYSLSVHGEIDLYVFVNSIETISAILLKSIEDLDFAAHEQKGYTQ